jgi:hypothetical protein
VTITDETRKWYEKRPRGKIDCLSLVFCSLFAAAYKKVRTEPGWRCHTRTMMNMVQPVRHDTLTRRAVKDQSPVTCATTRPPLYNIHNNIPLPVLAPIIPFPDSDRCDTVVPQECMCIHPPRTEVVPCYQQVLSDPRMVASRQKRVTSGSCACRISRVCCFQSVYLSCGVGLRTIYW